MVVLGVRRTTRHRRGSRTCRPKARREDGRCHIGRPPQALDWAAKWPERSWALEDCRHVTRRLEGDLLSAGEVVTRVLTRLMAGARRGGREQGKSDPILDALAVARAALREPGLPTARLDGEARELRLLVDHRDDLVAERTRIQSRLRWHLHELVPDLELPPRVLRRLHVLDSLKSTLKGLDGTVARIARELVSRTQKLTVTINDLEERLVPIAKRLAPSLLELKGCGALSAAKIVGQVAGADRFESRGSFARWNGTAPIPASSGNSNHVRLNRGGNRQVNAALHRIAITQWRQSESAGHAYVARRMANGDTKTEAFRLLRRRLSDEVLRRLLADHDASDQSLVLVAA